MPDLYKELPTEYTKFTTSEVEKYDLKVHTAS